MSSDDSTVTPVMGPAPDDAVHVMSYNLRYPAPETEHLWPDRRAAMSSLLRAERPCILATQEGHYEQLEDLRADLDGYRWIGLGRDGGSSGEHTAVFCDTDRTQVLAFDHLWLSDTPREIGSRSWGNDITRMLTWVRLGTAAGQCVVINVHLDHMSCEARRRGARMLAELAASFSPTPVVITGDFNTGAGTTPYRELVPPLVDTWNSAQQRLTPEHGTFTGYGPIAPGGRIDWILTSGELTCRSAAINPCAGLARMPSDHLPVQALVAAD